MSKERDGKELRAPSIPVRKVHRAAHQPNTTPQTKCNKHEIGEEVSADWRKVTCKECLAKQRMDEKPTHFELPNHEALCGEPPPGKITSDWVQVTCPDCIDLKKGVKAIDRVIEQLTQKTNYCAQAAKARPRESLHEDFACQAMLKASSIEADVDELIREHRKNRLFKLALLGLKAEIDILRRYQIQDDKQKGRE